MSRTFNDMAIPRAQREALYRRQAKLTRERDRFPFSNFNARLFVERKRFDNWLESLPRDSNGDAITSRGI